MLKALTGAKIIDGKGNKPYSASIVIEGSKIIEISNRKIFDKNTDEIDLKNCFILPGFIDCHIHLSPKCLCLISSQDYPLGYLASQTIHAMRSCLDVGVTTARDVGGLDAGYVQAQKDGLIQAPRLQTSVNIIHPTNGLLDNLPGFGRAISAQGLYAVSSGIPMNWADGPWEVRKKVREMLRYGAQIIKIANDAFSIDKPWLNPERTLFTGEELQAVVDEAHKAGVPVACHAWGTKAILDAVKAGVDTLEHGNALNEESINEMLKRGTWYVPTIAQIICHSEENMDPDVRAMWAKVVKTKKKSFISAIRAGVKTAMGSDNVLCYGGSILEIPTMVETGMSPIQAIEAATKCGAELMGMQDIIGSLEVGKEADLVVFSDNPLNEISILKDLDKIALVMQAGKIVSGKKKYSKYAWEKPIFPAKI
ncbi:MAG TPA: amidohydrolase family protein [Victivallales bacterium]|nr:amidohydrolase family protein [Victivallales bacterium]